MINAFIKSNFSLLVEYQLDYISDFFKIPNSIMYLIILNTLDSSIAKVISFLRKKNLKIMNIEKINILILFFLKMDF